MNEPELRHTAEVGFDEGRAVGLVALDDFGLERPEPSRQRGRGQILGPTGGLGVGNGAALPVQQVLQLTRHILSLVRVAHHLRRRIHDAVDHLRKTTSFDSV